MMMSAFRRLVYLAVALSPAAALAQTYTVISSFPSTDPNGQLPTGPAGGGAIGQFAQAPNGLMYGITVAGGTYSAGAVFSVDPTSGAIKAIYQNCPAGGSCPNPGFPETNGPQGLIVAQDGNLYGVSSQGGTNGYGGIFQLTTGGTLKVLHAFDFTDGAYPEGQLTLGSDGNLYGTTSAGGSGNCPNFFGTNNGCGTIFKVTTAGAFTKIYDFQNGTDGAAPSGPLVQAANGTYYGLTSSSVYTFTTSNNKVTTLATSVAVATGAYFIGPPSIGRNGQVYWVSQYDGASPSQGAVFTENGGTITEVYGFGSQANYADGIEPLSPLVEGTDGNFYGTNSQGGDNNCASGFGCGVIFEVTPAGTFTNLHTFPSDDSTGVLAGNSPIQGRDGNFYGSATNGDACNQCGVIYRLTPATALKPPVQLTLSETTVTPNTGVKLSWTVNNAISLTSQQCYAFGGGTGAGTWTGKQSGTYSSSTYAWTGSTTITPTANGTYTYELECGGTYSGAVTLTVAASQPKVNTTTALTVSPNPVYTDQNVTVTATVKKSSGSGVPTGNVVFSASGVTLATVALNGSGVASFTAPTSAYPPGSYSVTAAYQGDSTDNASTSPAVNVTLKAPAKTTTTLTSSASSVTPPASVTLTATVTSTTGTPTGNVTFYVNGIALGTVPTNSSGVAKLSGSTSGQPAGSYTVTAKYLGDTDYAASTSNGVPIKIN